MSPVIDSPITAAQAPHDRTAIASYFVAAPHGSDRWERMARVLLASARDHLPGWECRAVRLEAPELPPVRAKLTPAMSWIHNTHKLHHWRDVVHALEDGIGLLLIDADTMIRRTLDPVWAHPFDVAVTIKGNRPRMMPLNGGVVFVRIGDAARAFFDRWVEVNDRLYQDPVEHARYHDTWGGINQSALGAMLGDELRVVDAPGECMVSEGVRIRRLDCREWNACYDPLWATAPDHARIVHYKSNLRRLIFQGGRPHRHQQLVSEWRTRDQEQRA